MTTTGTSRSTSRRCPRGTVLPTRNVLVQVINADPKYYWVTSSFETSLLRAVWYPTTVGTVSWMCKQILR